jgi:hypothetical protein
VASSPASHSLSSHLATDQTDRLTGKKDNILKPDDLELHTKNQSLYSLSSTSIMQQDPAASNVGACMAL